MSAGTRTDRNIYPPRLILHLRRNSRMAEELDAASMQETARRLYLKSDGGRATRFRHGGANQHREMLGRVQSPGLHEARQTTFSRQQPG